MPSTLLEQQNFFRTELNQAIVDATDIIIYLKTLPTKEKGYLVIEQDDTSKREIIYYTSLGSGTVILDDVSGRGIGGTTAQSHADDSDVVMDDVAEYHNPIITLLSNYRDKCGLSTTGETDDITALAGNIVINGAVCTNATSETLSDIGASGTNKSGNVSSGGYRYIYAQDDLDATWSLYVSNNTSETGKRRLGFAKFKEGSTTLIRYVYDDDDYSPIARGTVLEWNGPLTDIPIGYALCNGVTAGTPNCSDRFVVTAGTTYAFGTTGGAPTINIYHSHTVTNHVHSGPEHYHTGGNHQHSSNFNTGAGLGGTDVKYGTTGAAVVKTYDHHHAVSGWSDAGQGGVNTGNAGTGNTGGATPGTSSVLSGTQSIMPPYIALVRIMRI